MTTAEFNSLPKTELLKGARQAIKQAKALYNSAQTGATSGNYGIANSLMILSVEETIKCMILLAGYFNIPLKFEIKPFFSLHWVKHDQAAEIQPMIQAIWKVRDLFVNLLKGKGSLVSAMIGAAILLAVDQVSGPRQRDNFIAWWKDANTQKNNGFYVGYFNGQWCFPADITESKYQETLQMTQPFIECLQIAEALNDDDYKMLVEGKLGLIPLGESNIESNNESNQNIKDV